MHHLPEPEHLAAMSVEAGLETLLLAAELQHLLVALSIQAWREREAAW